ncbi:NAD(P)H-hydrate dehydratase [Prolixibacteraceae bacterium JC049]|nr:NAD(P)H-hydrate dehydratase [Prolixibacteraceae bacterium JC049]
MKLFTCQQIAEIDAYTIANEPIRDIDLMERASKTIVSWVKSNISNHRPIFVFAGPGNNGGDALAIARLLNNEHYNVKVFQLDITDRLSESCEANMKRLTQWGNIEVSWIKHISQLPVIPENAIVLDGIFGSGLNRPAEGFPGELIQHINHSEATVISVDIPSGFMGENNTGYENRNIIRADVTLTFQFPKLSFLLPESGEFIHHWQVLPIGLHSQIIAEMETPYHTISNEKIAQKLIHRKRFSHKGNYGHALLIAGSYGKMGASVLASQACLRSGVGLLTTHTPHNGYQILQTTVPEAMISIDRSDLMFTEFPDLINYTAIGIGPGLGTKVNTLRALEKLIHTNQAIPMVIDADGINLLAMNDRLLSQLPKGTVLTPHPKEFERLVGQCSSGYNRLLKQMELAREYELVVVLKGAYTSVALPNGTVWFNTTGNPGMATAGSGDVLTGMILALLAQGYSSEDAAMIAVFLHGKAGDIAIKSMSQEALIASDLINHIGIAFNQVRLKK